MWRGLCKYVINYYLLLLTNFSIPHPIDKLADKLGGLLLDSYELLVESPDTVAYHLKLKTVESLGTGRCIGSLHTVISWG